MVVALTLRQWDNLCAATGMTADCEALGKRLGVDLRLEGERFKARHAITTCSALVCRARCCGLRRGLHPARRDLERIPELPCGRRAGSGPFDREPALCHDRSTGIGRY